MRGHHIIVFTLFFLIHKGSSTLCYIGNSSFHRISDIIDCTNNGLLETELYCRNITSPDGSIHRSCVSMSQYDSSWEEFGCQSSNGGFIRCICGHDFCNVPWSYDSSSSSSVKKSIGFLYSLLLICSGSFFH
uniref:Protein quiver n=1 Tax=Lepeophtheirus salmonis TaxID=72036 RepID=A0A0K2T2A1_LEPSM